MRNYKAPRGFLSTKEVGYDDIQEEATVYISPAYVWEDENPRKYFVCELSKGFALIADTKKELREARGHIYSIYNIDYYKNV